jgi:TonB family protein
VNPVSNAARGSLPALPSARRWVAALLIAVLLHGVLLWRWNTPDANGTVDPGLTAGAGAARTTLAARVLALQLSNPVPAPNPGSSAATASPPTVSPAAGDDATAADTAQRASAARGRYYAQLRAHLQRYRRVPADGAQLHGRAVVGFTVAADGSVSAVRLLRGAGFPALDAEALALIRRAAPLPKPPQARELRLSVPVVYE